MRSVYVINYQHISDNIFYAEDGGIDGRNKFAVYLREEIERAGYRFQTTTTCEDLENPAALLCLATLNGSSPLWEKLAALPRERSILFAQEPMHLTSSHHLYSPMMKDFFGCMFMTYDDLVDNQFYFKTFHPIVRDKLVDSVVFEQRGFCIMMQTKYTDNDTISSYHSLYGKRTEVAEFLGRNPDEFYLFGNKWEGNRAWRSLLKSNSDSYQMIWNKLDILNRFKFCICYENMHHQRGYITERLFECMYGRTVPIYWGADNITDYVPKECFVDRRIFRSDEELYRFMKEMDAATHQSYLDAAAEYVKGPRIQPFYARNVAKRIVDKIKEIDRS